MGNLNLFLAFAARRVADPTRPPAPKAPANDHHMRGIVVIFIR
jgi:hypothetical protein